MAKRNVNVDPDLDIDNDTDAKVNMTETETTETETTEEPYLPENSEEDPMDFNIEEEYVIPPLIPGGVYHACVTEVKYDSENNIITWTFTLSDNGGVMNDGSTEIDGSTLSAKNFLPNLGDDVTMTKSGKQTKRQAKINMLANFAKGLKINMNNMSIIRESIENSEWLGIDVNLKVGIREYEGRFFNEVIKAITS